VRAAVAAVLGTALIVPSFSFAAAAAEEDEDEELAEVQVTGTRIQVPGNYTAANPMTTISAEEMRRLGIVNVADALLQLVPQNVSTWTDFAVSDMRAGPNMAEDGADRTQYFIGNTIANLRGLDPAFGSRTLTLVDGRRVVSTSSQADVVDMNIIPSNLLSRMDVVTGGASATYGSGAVAGVVNLVLNNRLTGFNMDVDYGVNERGDGGSPHVSLSGGMPLFEGRGHALLGVEWQETAAIQNCAAARDWCAASRTLFTNSANNLDSNPLAVLTGQRPGFTGFPGRFQLDNMRYSQFSPNGVVLITGQPNATTGFRLTDDGTGIEEYALGYRGGAETGQAVNGDGPVITDGTSLRSGNERKTLFANFEYNITERTTGYIQANYAKTEGINRNTYTTSTNCVKFGTRGVAEIPGVNVVAGQTIPVNADNAATIRAASFRNFIGGAPTPDGFFGFNTNFVAPYYLGGAAYPAGGPPPPYPSGGLYNFGGRATGVWTLSTLGDNNQYWVLQSITMTAPLSDPGAPAILPVATGRDAYAYLRNLSPEALEQIQRGFGNSTATGNAGVASYLFGNNPCTGFTAIKKVWSPQFRRFSSNESETMRAVVGVKGRYGRDWRWDASFQYGKTDSASYQNNAATNIRQAFAMDAVIDDRAGSATFGQPICRVSRDGVPVLDTSGRPLGDLPAIQSLAVGCKPLNIFGSVFTGADAVAQQEAIDYAFIDNNTVGENSLASLSLTTNGTLWQGWGAGPLTGAFGLEYRKDEVDNSGSLGNYYEKFDIATGWSDKFGGSTEQTESFMELNLPLVSGVPGINLLSISGAVRYNQIKNKGGAGTSGDSLTQDTTNWKFSTVFEPFDWLRLRLTRSRDLRAPGYRDLFIRQPTPGGPNFLGQENPWRERTAASTENQQERVGTVTVGNPELKPETSNTLTLGLVLSPGGWAQGMRLSADYYNIKVRGGFYTSYANANPIQSCWEKSGNQYPEENNPSSPYIFDQFDETVAECQNIQFAELRDANGDAIPGSRDLSDIVWYNLAKPENGLPYQRRGVDLAWNYLFPLSKAFESVPGSVSLTVRAQRALEASGSETVFIFCGPPACPAGVGNDVPRIYNMVGQIRSANYIPGVTPSPKWSGNVITSYILGDFNASLSARYIGGAKIDNTWADPSDPDYQNEAGQFLNGSVDRNFVKPYALVSLNASYDMQISNIKQFQVFGSVNNLFDKDPPWAAGYISGTTGAYDTMGRAYRMGVRMKF
jgi:outer membrane receptor protein involved in Fe transport